MNQYYIEEYNFLDFVMHLQRMLKQGYTVDETTQGCPRGMLGHYTTKLNAPEVQTAVAKMSAPTDTAHADTPVVRSPGRPRKNPE